MKKSNWVTPKIIKVGLPAAIVLLVLTILPLASQAAPLMRPSWRAEYYADPGLGGQPKIVRWEDGFGHDWGYGSPAMGIPNDHFSARWTNRLEFEKGTYLFAIDVDDGARVWLDGKLIIDAWSVGAKQVKAKVRIDTTGDYEVQVAYFENTQVARVQMDWVQLAGEDEIVGAWLGEYYNNRHLVGDPVVTRQDSGINFNWSLGSPSPKVPRDNFSVRWTRSVLLKEGLYNFKIQHDDGMRIFIDGKIIYDSWYDQPVSYKTRRVPLQGGYRTLVVEYYDHVGNAIAVMDFEPDPGDYSDYESEPGSNPPLIIKTSSKAFQWGGPASDRFVSSGGFGGGQFFWTHNTSVKAVNYGRWFPGLVDAGNYEIYAYIPGNSASTSNARYLIHHYGKLDERSVSQGQNGGRFVSLGIYYFSGNRSDEFVELYDSTGENPGSTRIAFDALKFVRR